jgi:hypothetical protein
MEKLNKIIMLLQRYMEKGWFGKVEISFEKGNIVNLKVTENIKL